MRIDKHYEESVIIHGGEKPGDYTAVKLGITIHSDKDLKSIQELEMHSDKLNQLARQIIAKELVKIKTEKQQIKEG